MRAVPLSILDRLKIIWLRIFSFIIAYVNGDQCGRRNSIQIEHRKPKVQIMKTVSVIRDCDKNCSEQLISSRNYFIDQSVNWNGRAYVHDNSSLSQQLKRVGMSRHQDDWQRHGEDEPRAGNQDRRRSSERESGRGGA